MGLYKEEVEEQIVSVKQEQSHAEITLPDLGTMTHFLLLPPVF